MKVSKFIIWIACCMYSLVGHSQNEQLEKFSTLLVEKDNIFIKIVSKSYTNETLQETDTIYYIKNGAKSFYKTGELEYLIDTDLLLVDHSSKMITMQVYEKGKFFDPLQLERDSTTSRFSFDTSCNCLKQKDPLGDKDTYIELYFNSDNTLQKTVYQVKHNGKIYRSVAVYEVFCTEKNCFSFSLPSKEKYLSKQGKDWKATPNYKNYLLNIY